MPAILDKICIDIIQLRHEEVQLCHEEVQLYPDKPKMDIHNAQTAVSQFDNVKLERDRSPMGR